MRTGDFTPDHTYITSIDNFLCAVQVSYTLSKIELCIFSVCNIFNLDERVCGVLDVFTTFVTKYSGIAVQTKSKKVFEMDVNEWK